MIRKQEELLAELDSTLDQLIQNASVVCGSDLHVLDSIEIHSLQKTQESLMAKFAHTQENLVKPTSQKRYEDLHKKLQRLNELNSHFMKQLEQDLKPQIGRNRKRSKLGEFAKSRL